MPRMLLTAAVLLVLVTFGAVIVSRAWGKTVIKEPTTMPASASPLDFEVTDIDGKPFALSSLKGKVVMFVNVASKCGLTPQYAKLQALYEKHKDRGLVIVGFPANNFGSQEPGTNEQIKTFCSTRYQVSFPMMSKISVKGADKHPLYKFLTEQPNAGEFAGDIEWNFAKFLVDRNGQLIARFASRMAPDDQKLIDAVEAALTAPAATTQPSAQ